MLCVYISIPLLFCNGFTRKYLEYINIACSTSLKIKMTVFCTDFCLRFSKTLSPYQFTIAILSYPLSDGKLRLMEIMGLAEVCTIKPIVWIVFKTFTFWSTTAEQYFLIYYDGRGCCIEFSGCNTE